MGTGCTEIAFGCSQGGLHLAFEGEATRQACPAADRLVTDYLATNHEHATIIIDLRDAVWVDSTFAGWMLRVRKQLAQSGGGPLYLAGCSGRCEESLRTMRLTALFETSDVPRPEKMGRVACVEGAKPDRAAIELMAQAHEELAVVDPANKHVFAPIAAMLRKELEKGA